MSANPDFVYSPPMHPFINVIYQDDDFIILDKSSGLLSVPGRLPEHQDCLQNRVQKVLPSATIVHRLDMATSGIMVMALNKAAHVAISRQFEKRETSKSYIARVYGEIKEETGSVDLPLICDWPNRPKQMVDHENGKKSLTHFKVIKREALEEAKSTLVELTPITGRSHQLRVHMLALGHPILGDRLYAHEEALRLSSRLQLHAQYLSFFHPTNQQRVAFSSTCPFL